MRWECHTVLGFVWRQQCYFHTNPVLVSAASFYIITSKHCDNPNISPRFMCQMSYTISDKNNGLPESESQVSERWTNTRQQCFLGRGDDQEGDCSRGKGFPVWIRWKKTHLGFPLQPSFVIAVRLQRKRWPRSTNGIWHKENISRLLLIKATLVESVICQSASKSLKGKTEKWELCL